MPEHKFNKETVSKTYDSFTKKSSSGFSLRMTELLRAYLRIPKMLRIDLTTVVTMVVTTLMGELFCSALI